MGVHHAWGAPTRTCSCAGAPCRATGSATRTASTARAVGRGGGGEGEGVYLQARHRGVRHRALRGGLQGAGAQVRRIQTRQSQRLGYWMDWDDSYHTMSDENNYTIWHFLKRCHENGWLYRGTDSMPWCARCGTGLSQHEIVTEGYQDVTHTAVYVRLPLTDADGESLLIWTTTPWTLTANVAAAVHPEHRYVRARVGGEVLYLGKERLAVLAGGRGAGDSAKSRCWRSCRQCAGGAHLPRTLRRTGGAARRRASRYPLDGRGRGRGYRDRPHRPRRRPRGLCPRQGAWPARGRPARRERLLRRRLRLAYRTERVRRARPHLCRSYRERLPVQDRGTPAPLSVLLALQQRAGVPGGGRVVHLHGRTAPHHDGDYPQRTVDPAIRAGARA